MEKLDDILDIEGKEEFDGKTPGYIKVFAILTIIGSSLMMVKDFIYMWFLSMANTFTSAFDRGNNLQEINNVFRWMIVAMGVEALSCILAIIGAALMLKLKKFGFITYIASFVVFVAGVVIFNIFSIGQTTGIESGSVIVMVIYAAIPAGFFIVYMTASRYFIK